MVCFEEDARDNVCTEEGGHGAGCRNMQVLMCRKVVIKSWTVESVLYIYIHNIVSGNP
jgi:hypothetical protein